MKFIQKTLVALGIFALAITSTFAQRHVCGFDEKFQESLSDPRVRAEYERLERNYQEAVQRGTARSMGGVRKIPVVVHVIQTSAMELVTMDIIQSQIDVLNEDFRRMAGTPGFGNGVDYLYEFQLATIDPNGCPTTGVNRLINPTMAFHDKNDETAFKALIQWPPTKYLNIWVPRTIETNSTLGSVIGYATFPSSINFQSHLDGVVIHSGFFGRNSNPTYGGRTTTHEVGHWIGLFHTFQFGCQGSSASTCLTGGDRVCDTPQALDANFGCPSINSCTDTPTDLPDQIENYMDYSDGSCQNMFTQGQKTRTDQIMASYRSVLTSPANLSATGVDGTLAPGCTPTTNFEADRIVVCTNTPVNFKDISSGSPNAWNWTFQGGTPGNANVQNPQVIYTAPGTYNVTLSAASTGGTDSEVKSAFIKVVNPSMPILAEGFEGLASGLPGDWYTYDEDKIGSWTLATNAGATGSKSIKVKNYGTYSEGSNDDLYLVPMDFTNVITSSISYAWAYKKRTSFARDSLAIHISTDCGVTWTNLRTKVQGTLATVGGFATAAEFVPTSTQWLRDTISLDSFAGQPSVRILFRVSGNDGQSIYVDDINLNNTMVSRDDQVWNKNDIKVYPNPFSDRIDIHYNLEKAGNVRFRLIDLQGRALYTSDLMKLAAGSHHNALEMDVLKNLARGTYFLQADGPGGRITTKLVKM